MPHGCNPALWEILMGEAILYITIGCVTWQRPARCFHLHLQFLIHTLMAYAKQLKLAGGKQNRSKLLVWLKAGYSSGDLTCVSLHLLIGRQLVGLLLVG